MHSFYVLFPVPKLTTRLFYSSSESLVLPKVWVSHTCSLSWFSLHLTAHSSCSFYPSDKFRVSPHIHFTYVFPVRSLFQNPLLVHFIPMASLLIKQWYVFIWPTHSLSRFLLHPIVHSSHSFYPIDEFMVSTMVRVHFMYAFPVPKLTPHSFYYSGKPSVLPKVCVHFAYALYSPNLTPTLNVWFRFGIVAARVVVLHKSPVIILFSHADVVVDRFG